MRVLPYILILITTLSCSKHKLTNIKLLGYKGQKSIKYCTPEFDFYIGEKDFLKRCKDKLNKQKIRKDYEIIIKFIESNEEEIIEFSDTLKIMTMETDTILAPTDKYIYPIDIVMGAIFDFAKIGKIRVFNKKNGNYICRLKIDEVEHYSSGETIMYTEDNIEILFLYRWAI